MFNHRHFHDHDNSTHINFPDTIKVHEHKAPTDESIRLMEEMHHKAIKNIIAHVKIEDNIVNGQCWAVRRMTHIQDVLFIFKFKINGKEFTVEKEYSTWDLANFEDRQDIERLTRHLQDEGKGLLLWYALKMFQMVAYEQITGQKPPIEYK